ncbi:MAG: hypothetical protein HOY79_17940 [Streptomyces sp.]|nr:hypothetical protein [Streptomyces sp.]
MNFFRQLVADLPGELLAAQVAATSRVAEATEATAQLRKNSGSRKR